MTSYRCRYILLFFSVELEVFCIRNFSVFCRLHFLFGKNFERASRVVDQRGVKRICGQPSGRSVFQVVGESKKKEEYLCFPEQYCACYSFFYDVVNRGEQLCCKHQLAARLAKSLGACIEVMVSDEELAVMLSQL
nr:zinc finger SWIM domain-containing protein 7 [Ipomoea batatas]